MTIADDMRDKLQSAFAPAVLEVVDDSESHRGHSGFQEGGESHFNVVIKSPKFNGLSRIERHRAVHSALGKDIMERIHALALDISE